MNILKVFFGNQDNGDWQIKSMKPIPLDPENGHDGDFYPIRENIFLADTRLAGTIKSFMGQSIVPVVAQVAGESILRCLGTGFFISCSGLLITAAHVITDPIERKYGGVRELDDHTWSLGDLKLGVMLPTNPIFEVPGYFFRDMEWAGFLGTRAETPLPIRGVDLKLTSDTAICKIAPIAKGVPHQPLSIIQSGLRGIGMGVGKKKRQLSWDMPE